MMNINSTTQPQRLTDEQKEETISLIEILLRFMRYWKWFVIGIALALALAFLYLRYTTPVYNVTSSIILKESKNQRFQQSLMGGMDGLQLG